VAATTKAYDANTVRDRLHSVLNDKFKGSIERMALKMGVTAGYVRMVLSGARKPPPWALKLVAMEALEMYSEVKCG